MLLISLLLGIVQQLILLSSRGEKENVTVISADPSSHG